MPVSMYPVGAILKEWRESAGMRISDVASELINGGMLGTYQEIQLFVDRLEEAEEWIRDYSCDGFDEFLSALNARVRRVQVDDDLWLKMYLAFKEHRLARIVA